MTPDPEKVKEALDVPARPLGHGADVPADLRGMYALPLSVIDARTVAARSWLAGTDIQWCERHYDIPHYFDPQTGGEFCEKGNGAPDCRFVTRRLSGGTG